MTPHSPAKSHHGQEACWASPVPDRGEVDDHGDVLVAFPRVAPHVFVNPDDRDPSNRAGSAMRTRCPSASTASFAVFHATARASATRATVRCCTTRAVNAHVRPAREIFALGGAALVISWRHTCPHPVHRYLRTVTSSVVGRHPNGSCASSRSTLSRTTPSHPHLRHQRSTASTRHASTARPGSIRCPVTSNPSASRPANVVRSGQAKVASGTSRSSRWAV